jgi:hypothetical protein
MIMTEVVTLQNAATATGNGETLVVGTGKKLGVQVFGTSTSCTVIAETSLDGAHWSQLAGINAGDQKTILETIVEATSAVSKVVEYDVERWAFFRTRVSAIGNGNVTVLVNKIY